MLTLNGCKILPKEQEQSIGTTGGDATINDPRGINILAYTLGGSVLLTALGQIWYNRARIKNIKKGH